MDDLGLTFRQFFGASEQRADHTFMLILLHLYSHKLMISHNNADVALWQRGSIFFPSAIFTFVLLSQISLLLLRVTVKFGFAPFCFDQYATACEQGQSAETCYASWNILREKLQERVIVYQEVWGKIEEHHECRCLPTYLGLEMCVDSTL